MKKIAQISLSMLFLFIVSGILFIGCNKKSNDGGTSQTLTITDQDGNLYHTITIGTQVWFVENLKTTKYNDGTPIQLVTDKDAWRNLTTQGFCWHDNAESTYKNPYGALYNWFAVATGKLAPKGWHVPTDAEWNTLTTYLGGDSVAGGKLKEAGISHWQSPNTGATNETGFTAVPGGFRFFDGFFGVIGKFGYWWSSSEYDTVSAGCRVVVYDYSNVFSSIGLKNNGYSVRCLRD